MSSTRSDDYFSSQWALSQDRPTGPQRGVTLQISTSRGSDGTSQSQSSSSSFALPPSPHRTAMIPLPSSATPQYATAGRSMAPDTPRSAGYNDRSTGFRASSTFGSKSPTSPGSKRRSDSSMLADKRLSPDPKSNVYTQCGRHGDEWLFGGFPFNNFKKAWDKKE